MEIIAFVVSILESDPYKLKLLQMFLDNWDISQINLSSTGTALHHATLYHYSPVIELLLSHPEHPLDVNTVAGKFGTALQAAAVAQRKGEEQASLYTVELLVSRGANLSLTGGMKFSPLHAAVFERNTHIVKYLLSRMKSDDILRAGGEHGTVLQALLSRQNDHWSEVDGEEDIGDNPDGVTEELFNCLLGHGESVMREGRPQDPSALHRAAQYASLRILELVMKQPDVNIEKRDIMGRLPIRMAVRHSRDPWEIITTLDPALSTLWEQDYQYRTVLHLAAGVGAIDVIRNILNTKKKDGDGEAIEIVNRPDIHGWTPLHWACRQSKWDVVELLIEEGASKTARTDADWLPRHVAIHHDKTYYDDLPNDEERSERDNDEADYSMRRDQGSGDL
ncbi:hypothetical protein N0V85_009458 [Neurospora sp. IMI 360204]|nr:hypothetical protein N0V85_009458 [Neurospora sp. IMI 360204]